MKSNKYSKNNRSSSKKKTAILIIVAVLLVVGSVFAYNRYHNNDSEQPESINDSDINYGPPSQQEIDSAEDHKKAIDKNQDQSNSSNNSSDTKKSVKPVIISYGQGDGKFELSGRVPGILENSGTCTLTMTRGSSKATGSNTASPNVSEMSCGFIAIPLSKLGSGSWTAKITYKSSKAQGVSEPWTVEVE